MPYSFEIEANSGLAVATCTGVLTLQEAIAGVRELWALPEWKGQGAVWDLRSARLDFATPEIREAAQFVLAHQPRVPPVRVAFVTGQDADFGQIRIFEVFRESPDTEVRVFRNLPEALVWARELSG